MRFGALIALGLVFATGLGVAGHLIARDTVALPVASIEAGDGLAPPRTRTGAPARRKAPPVTRTATQTTTTTGTQTTRTTDDRSGRGRGRGRGGDDSSGSGSSGSGSGSSGSGSGRDHPEDD
jgi:uncharacterized membrane protein YgcG